MPDNTSPPAPGAVDRSSLCGSESRRRGSGLEGIEARISELEYKLLLLTGRYAVLESRLSEIEAVTRVTG